ncbi:uncharacterized protein [Dendrobates tinctorius]|uniref:uncharacterized protein isoform X1 n=1 Tax=Dendrobates tinctorius TaxID=92724 RepID=UPI003CCA0779
MAGEQGSPWFCSKDLQKIQIPSGIGLLKTSPCHQYFVVLLDGVFLCVFLFQRNWHFNYCKCMILMFFFSFHSTWSSTLQPVSEAVLHRTTLDPSQPSDSQEAACGSAPQTAGDQEAGQSGIPLSQFCVTGFAGTSHQWQKASDRTVMPEFLHLSSVFQHGLKALSDRQESGFALMENRFQAVDRRLNSLEADLNRPAHHFFHQIERGMAEHLSPDLQLNVMQTCNTAYMQAMQQSQYVQQSAVAFPTVPPLTRFTPLPTSAAYHCMSTCIPSHAGHQYTTTRPSAAGHFPATTMASAAPAWTTTTTTPPAWTTIATTPPAWTTTTSPAWTTTATTPAWTTTVTTPSAWTSTVTTPPAWTSTATTPPVWSTTATSIAWTTTTTTVQQQLGNTHSLFAPTDPVRTSTTTCSMPQQQQLQDPAIGSPSSLLSPSSRRSRSTRHSRQDTPTGHRKHKTGHKKRKTLTLPPPHLTLCLTLPPVPSLSSLHPPLSSPLPLEPLPRL